jgi:hypothetical protein
MTPSQSSPPPSRTEFGPRAETQFNNYILDDCLESGSKSTYAKLGQVQGKRGVGERKCPEHILAKGTVRGAQT